MRRRLSVQRVGQNPGPMGLSVIVITRNEAANIDACVQSVSFADEIVVVDAGSRDDTVARARSLGARVIETADWPGFGRQKNRALDAATHDWVLSIDADERVSPELAASIRAVVAAAPGADAPAYALSRRSSFCGQWMRASGWYPDPVMRLFARTRARFSDDQVHERVLFDGATRLLAGELLHHSIPTLENAIDKMNRYSSGRAHDLLARGRSGSLGRAVAHGLWAFIRTYVFKRGFLDGRLGFVLAVNNAEASYYRYLKMWLAARANGGQWR